MRPLALVLALASLPLGAQQPNQNLGFEVSDATGRPVGWGVDGQGYEIVVDSAQPFAGRHSLRTRWIDAAPRLEASRQFAAASQAFPLTRVMGRRLHLTGYIRTQDVHGYAGFWMRVDGPGNAMLGIDNMAQRGPRGTTPWTRYDIELPVDSGATFVVFGVLHPGDGTAWFDSIRPAHVAGEFSAS